MIIRFLFIIICTCVTTLYGQHPYFISYGSADGLVSESVYCAFQDKEGYMWFGTDAGVSRFDGLTFENFDFSDGLTGNEIFSMHQDYAGRIWFLSFNGAFSYYLDGQFFNDQNDPNLEGLGSKYFLNSVIETPDSVLYFSAANGDIFRIDSDFNVEYTKTESPIFRIWLNDQGQLMILTAIGIERFEKNGTVILEENEVFESYSRSIFRDNVLYYNNDCLLFGFNGTEKEYIMYLEECTEVTWIGDGYQDGTYYIGTRSGFYSIDPNKKEKNAATYLKNTTVTQTFIDREDNLWVTSLGQGIFLSSSPEIQVYDQSGALEADQITCLTFENDSTLWIGMINGSYAQMNIHTGELQVEMLLEKSSQPIKKIKKYGNYGMYVLGKSGSKLVDGEKELTFPFIGNDIVNDGPFTYIASKQVFRIDSSFFQESIDIEKLTSAEKNEFMHSYDNSIVLGINTDAFIFDNERNLYAGTQKGLYKKRADEEYPQPVLADVFDSPVIDLEYDSRREILYLATERRGVLMIHADTLVGSFNERKGLSSNNCRSLFLDEEGILWIGTTRSVDFIDTQNDFELVNFGKKVNLTAIRVNDILHDKGALFLATDRGLIVTRLDAFHEEDISPKLILNEMQVNARPYESIGTDEIELKYDQNAISFYYKGFYFSQAANLRYRYRLRGYQDKWRITKNDNITFEALPAGAYTFELEAVNLNGLVSERIAKSFSIQIPFWKEYWFYGLITFLIAGLITLLWFRRLRRIRAQFDFQNEINLAHLEKLKVEKSYLMAEQKAGVLQMNPHFLFNSLNTIKGYYAENNFSEANRFISKFATLLRKILESNTPLIPVQREIEIVTAYLELMQKRHDDLFSFEVNCDLEKIEELKMPPMMLQPLVENAIQHGVAPKGKGHVFVRFYEEEKRLKCIVEDDGDGFTQQESARLHKSVGLQNIKDRLLLLSKQYDIRCDLKITQYRAEDKTNRTRITITLPTQYPIFE